MHTVLLSHNLAHPTPQKLRVLLSGLAPSAEPTLVTLDGAEAYLANAAASCLLIVLSPAPEKALQTLRKVRHLIAGPALAVGPTSDPKLILRALDEGATHYVDEADLEGQLEAVLARLYTREPAPPAPAGRLVALLGASGGSGTSTVAVNLAAVLAREEGRCALVDLHPGSGDLAALLDLKPTHSLADLCLKASRIDQAMVESALVAHPAGIHLLAPPERYIEIPLVNAHGVHKVLSLTRQVFPFTVIDLEDCFHDEQVAALRLADSALIVFRPDFTSLRNTRRLLAQLDQIGLPRGRLQLVLNRCGQAKELPAEEVEQGLGLRIAHFIPDDPRTVNGANNTGIPAVLKAPSARVSGALASVARSVRPAPPSSPASTRRSGSWLAFR